MRHKLDAQFEVSSLYGLSDLITELGGNPDYVGKQCRFDLSALANSHQQLSYDKYNELLEAAAKATACPHFGLLLGQRADVSILGTLGQLTSNCQTAGEALATFIRYYNIVSLGEVFRFERGPLTSSLIREPTIPDLTLRIQVQDVTLSETYSVTKKMYGPSWKPTGIFLTHCPKDISIYQSLFGCPVHTNQNLQAMSFATSDLDLPLRKADAVLRQKLETKVAQLSRQNAKPFKRTVVDAIRIGLATRNCGIRQVADSLSMHTRTLHRKLLLEDTTFTQLLEDTRRHLADHLLAESQLSVFEISEALGYSDTTAFSRACRRWFNASPSKWRQAHLN